MVEVLNGHAARHDLLARLHELLDEVSFVHFFSLNRCAFSGNIWLRFCIF